MSKEQQSYGSAFLYAEDLLSDGKFKSVEVEISEVHEPGTIKKADGGFVDKPALSFKGATKKLVLCKTNVALIKFAVGDALPEKWVGKRIKLVVRLVDAFGSKVTAIRVWPSVPIRKGLVKYLGEEIK
jgi:hypothetical protein